jgi:hypothetical protein
VKPESVKASTNGASRAVVDLSETEPPQEPVAAKAPKAVPTPKGRRGRRGDVDRVALAREFGRLMDDEHAGGY